MNTPALDESALIGCDQIIQQRGQTISQKLADQLCEAMN